MLVPFPTGEFNKLKVVVFVETKPLTDNFEQIALREDQARTVRNSLWDSLGGIAKEHIDISTNPDHTYKFPNIPEIYTDKFFK